MEKKLSENTINLFKKRRSFYNITNSSLISDDEIMEIVQTVVTCTPSAFNSQSTRIVLLLNDQHKKFWELTKSVLQQITTKDKHSSMSDKVDQSFASGYGTILFFEDESVILGLQENFPTYKEKFPVWSQHTNAMHQLTMWVMLEDAGFGASLQHYNPVIDDEVIKTWNLDPNWKLIAQMPFGLPLSEPGEKESESLDARIKLFK